MLPPDTDVLDYLLSVPPEARREMVLSLGKTDAEGFDREWPDWAHEGQRPPDDCDWSTCVVMGGRSFGKTRAGSEWIVGLLKGPDGRSRHRPLRIALVRATLAEARSVMVEGRSGLLEVAGPWVREWRPSLGLLRFRTGAVATLFSGHSPELLRGPEHDYAWCDELAKWEKGRETWDMLQLGLRLGDLPRALVTTTPRPGPVLKAIMAEPGTVVIGGPSDSNPHNSPAWLSGMHARYAGTRLGRQELGGELLSDVPGALWTEALLDRCRAGPGTACLAVPPAQSPDGDSPRAPDGDSQTDCPHPPFTRLVIAVDPPSGDGTCGIVVCARDGEGRAHLLADHSVAGLGPEGWARKVADAAFVWGHLYTSVPVRSGTSVPVESDAEAAGGEPAPGEPRIIRTRGWYMCQRTGAWLPRPRPPRAPLGEGDHAEHGGGVTGSAPAARIPVTIVAEANQGGKMVASVIRIADPRLRVKLVHAVQGKSDRAAPVAMLFEAGRVALHGRFPELEAELCGLIAGGGYEGPGNSPDRADAMVWALTELMLTPRREPRILAL